jgi:flagellar hook-basal body complex protein FliE
MITRTPPLALFGSFNVHAPIPREIRGENLHDVIRKMKESVADVNRALENAPGGESFGERLKQAIKRKTGAARFVAATAAVTGESFGEKLKQAIEKKSGRKEREERLKRERERYPKRRPHTKGE